MHVLFVHQNYPAQFGHIARYLTEQLGHRCTFVTRVPPGTTGGVERIQYRLHGGATKQNHYCSRTFENAIWHSHGVFETLKARPDIRPDLVVGHSGFGSTLFLRELYSCPILNYFEYFYSPRDSDMDFRADFPSQEIDRLRSRARNAMILLDLDNCDAGQCPTGWQRDRFPTIYHPKLNVVFDGIDTNLWKPMPGAERIVAGQRVPDDMKIVTYATRGMESMRGFDIFMKLAKRIGDHRKDVLFVIAGQDRICYGGDEKYTGNKSFKQLVLSQDEYDLSRFVFLGLVPPTTLAHLFAISDLHVYLTVPFVLSWSLMNALACGATILASNTGPVREMIEPSVNGLLSEFFDIDAMVVVANRVLDDPAAHAPLGGAASQMIRERYSFDQCLPQAVRLYEGLIAARASKHPGER